MDDRSRSGSSDRAWHDFAEQWGHPGTTRGIRGGRRARARMAAYIAAASAEQAVDPLSIPVHRPGGQSIGPFIQPGFGSLVSRKLKREIRVK